MLHRTLPIDNPQASTGWEARLACVILTIGTPRFTHHLHHALGSLLPTSHVTIVEFSPALTPSIFLISSMRDEERAAQSAREYFDEFYKYDPNYSAIGEIAQTKAMSIVHPDCDDFSKFYRNRFFSDQKISDKLSILNENNGSIISSNIYKDQDNGMFTAAEIDNITMLAPIISAAVSRHCQALSLARIDLDMIIYAMAAKRAISFTARENDVCRGILRGQSSEAIGLSLGIATSSVITHRKNLYRKLNVVSQAELFSLAFDAVVIPS